MGSSVIRVSKKYAEKLEQERRAFKERTGKDISMARLTEILANDRHVKIREKKPGRKRLFDVTDLIDI